MYCMVIFWFCLIGASMISVLYGDIVVLFDWCIDFVLLYGNIVLLD